MFFDFNYVEEFFYCCAVIFFSFVLACNISFNVFIMTFLRRIFFLLLLSSAINISPTRANKEDVVCSTVDIRKSEEINKLENCTVVNGNVVLILGHIGSYEDKYTSEQINNWTFPLR